MSVGQRAATAASAARRAAGAMRDRFLAPVTAQHEQLALAIGRMEARAVRAADYADLRDVEFKVFSQWGEDGIIQYLISRVPIGRPAFVEFGVEDYRESNTRFLLQNDHWEGLVIDGGTSHLDFLTRGELHWRYSIEARSAFLTRENVNEVIGDGDGGMVGDIGLLSVDVDGNDYWLLDAITVVSPRILIVEYNSLFGPDAAVTVPYRPDFDRRAAHWSSVYYGASLAAVHQLAQAKGYRLVGCNRAGVNAFFVRADVVGDVPVLTTEAAYVPRHHREARDRDGTLTHIGDPAAQLALIADQPLVNVRTGRPGTVGELVTSA